LNERQLDALLYFKSKGEIISSQYQARFSIAARTARYDLTDLIEKKLLVKQGENKSTKYIFADKLPIKQ
jgi:ATP-dependent DNA helicase RecG